MDELIIAFEPREDTLMLSGSILEALKYPEYIQLSLDEGNCLLLIRACGKEDEQVIVLEPGVQEISGRNVMKKVKQLLHWYDDSPRLAYGVLLHTYNAVIFDLRDTEPAVIDKEGTVWTRNA